MFHSDEQDLLIWLEVQIKKEKEVLDMKNKKRTIIIKLVSGTSRTYFEVTSISSNSNELSIWHDNDEILTKFNMRDVEGFTFVQEVNK